MIPFETRAFPPGPDTPLPGGYSRGQLLGRVAAVYADRLAESTHARQYLADRNLWVPAMLKAFQVGVSDGKLMAMLPEDGELREALTWLGVLTPQGREHFQGCIVVPLEHPDHGVIGLYGRKMAPEAKIPHLYLPGPQRGVLNWQALKANREVWLAESVFDALSLWVAGCREMTCIYGVQGFTRDHEELFGRFATAEVRFCLDGDAAGRKATERLGAQLMGKGLRCLSVPMPDNQDANTVLVTRGADTLLKLLKEARPLESPAAEVVSTAEDQPQELRVSHQDVDLVLVAGPLVYQATPQPPFRGKLRVRLRVSADGKAVIDSLDLYSHRARMAAANQVSRRFDMPRETVEMHLLRLLEETERWVEAKTQADTEDSGALTTQKAPPMTEAEKAEALAFLQQPELVAALLDDMAALGSVGEEKGKLLIYLVGISRRLDRPLSAIILSQSGAGKSSLADLAELLCPPEEVVLFSRISAQALGYLPKDYLKRKLLILEERVGAEAADYSIRVLQSRQKLSQAVVVKDPTTGRMYTRHFEVEGPIAYIETTTNTTLNLENATRSFEVSLDESKEQTIRIQTAQRESRSPEGIIRRQQTDGIRRRHHNAQRLLEPVAVVVPYQSLLRFPNHWLRTRRDNERFICLVEAIAFLHQHQRTRVRLEYEGGAVDTIEATVEDYRLAYELALEVLGSTLHELSKSAQELWDVCRVLVAERQTQKRPAKEKPAQDGAEERSLLFTRRDLRVMTGWPDRRVREAVLELVQMEYLAATVGSQGKTYFYSILSEAEAVKPLSELTTPEQLSAMWPPTGL